MIIKVETNLYKFNAWSGAKFTIETLIEKGLLEELDNYLEGYMDELDEPWTETELNDFLWFDTEQIADILGYDSWYDLTQGNKREDE